MVALCVPPKVYHKISFSSEVNGLQHFRGKAHARAIELKEGPYRCLQCGLAFPRKNEFEQHVLSKAHIRIQLEQEAAKRREECYRTTNGQQK